MHGGGATSAGASLQSSYQSISSRIDGVSFTRRKLSSTAGSSSFVLGTFADAWAGAEDEGMPSRVVSAERSTASIPNSWRVNSHDTLSTVKSSSLTPPTVLRPDPASFVLIYVVMVVNAMNFTVVIPSCPEYVQQLGGSEFVSGAVVGIYCLAGGFMSLPVAWLLKRVSLRSFIMAAMFLSILGHTLYAVAGLVGSGWLLLLGRAAAGALGGPQVAGTYVTRASDVSRRSFLMVICASSSGVGYCCGAFGASAMNATATSLGWNYALLNHNNAGAWLMAVIAAVLFVLLGTVFIEPPPFATSTTHEGRRPCWCTRGVATADFTIFVMAICIASWETHSQRMAQDTWGWSVGISALYLAFMFAALVPVFLAGSLLSKLMSDRTALLVLALLALPSLALQWPSSGPGDWHAIVVYSAASFVTLFSVQVQRGFAQAAVTKLVRAESKQEAIAVFALLWLGGRFLGSIIGTVVPTERDYIGLLCCLVVLQLLLLSVNFGYMIPAPPLPVMRRP